MISEFKEMERRGVKLNTKQMSGKPYPLQKETLSIVTPPNETYNGKEIPMMITTTAGVHVQFRKRIKIFKTKKHAQSKKLINKAQLMTILKKMIQK